MSKKIMIVLSVSCLVVVSCCLFVAPSFVSARKLHNCSPSLERRIRCIEVVNSNLHRRLEFVWHATNGIVSVSSITVNQEEYWEQCGRMSLLDFNYMWTQLEDYDVFNRNAEIQKPMPDNPSVIIHIHDGLAARENTYAILRSTIDKNPWYSIIIGLIESGTNRVSFVEKLPYSRNEAMAVSDVMRGLMRGALE